MKDGPNIVGIAALIGDHARADILTALMGGPGAHRDRARGIAGVTKQTVSAHLAKLVDARLIAVEKPGAPSLLPARRPRRRAISSRA